MFLKLLESLAGIVGFVGRIWDFFFPKKPTETKIEDAQKKVQDEMDEFKKTGRPPH